MRPSVVISTILTLLFFNPSLTFGGASEAGAIFLMIFPGARATGMGGAFTAIADDALATYYNDAGLANQTSFNITGMHSNWLPGLSSDLTYDFLGVVYPLPQRGVIGVNMIYLNTGKTTAVTEEGIPIATYNTYDLAVKLSYGVEVLEGVSLGVGGKFIRQFLAPDWVLEEVLGIPGVKGSTNSIASDFSLLFYSPKSLWESIITEGEFLEFMPEIRAGISLKT